MEPRKTYHHGALREALLEAAEKILRTEGLPALSLRAIAREAGVSHGSPAHHFQDLSGLLSDLAAIGYLRLGEYLQNALDQPGATRDDTDRAYVRFALDNPALFSLMFREERLDSDRPSLVEARKVTFGILAKVSPPDDEPPKPGGSLQKMGSMIATWAFVHGFSILAIEGRLDFAQKLLPPGTDVMKLLDAALADLSGRRGHVVANLAAEKPPPSPAMRRLRRRGSVKN
jgi:AcrR family transcriptional regulator